MVIRCKEHPATTADQRLERASSSSTGGQARRGDITSRYRRARFAAASATAVAGISNGFRSCPASTSAACAGSGSRASSARISCAEAVSSGANAAVRLGQRQHRLPPIRLRAIPSQQPVSELPQDPAEIARISPSSWPMSVAVSPGRCASSYSTRASVNENRLSYKCSCSTPTAPVKNRLKRRIAATRLVRTGLTSAAIV